MPSVFCGLKCFDVPVASTASGVAREFSASLNPALALDRAGCPVEVYRLEPLALDAELALGERVVCSVPGWQFDFPALEELHRHFEDLRSDHEDLIVQYGRTKEALISVNASVEASEAGEAAAQRQARPCVVDSTSRGTRREAEQLRMQVEQLQMQLAQGEKKQQETKATVMALRSEFMQLVDVMAAAGGPKRQANFELPSVMKELDTNVKGWPQSVHSPPHSPGVVPHVADAAKPPRQTSQPPAVQLGRRPMPGSPRVCRAPPGAFSTPRGVARPRGVHPRGGHSVGAMDRGYVAAMEARR